MVNHLAFRFLLIFSPQYFLLQEGQLSDVLLSLLVVVRQNDYFALLGMGCQVRQEVSGLGAMQMLDEMVGRDGHEEGVAGDGEGVD